MRQRTHGKDAKSRQEILEERIDKEKQYGTYGAAISFCQTIQDEEKTYANEMNKKTTSIKKQKGKMKECSFCMVLTNHATWRSRDCPGHNKYLEQKNAKIVTYQQKTGKKRKCTNDGNVSGEKKKSMMMMVVVVASGHHYVGMIFLH